MTRMIRLAGLLFILIAASSAWAQELNRIVVVVNGSPITSYDLNQELETMAQGAAVTRRIEPTPENIARLRSDLREDVLKDMVDDRLMQEEIDRLGLSVDDSQVEAFVQRVMAGEGVETEEELAELLKNLNQTPESFRAKVRKDMLKQRLVQGMIGSKLVITDAQIEEEFAGSTEHSGGANYHLRVIMMPSAEELDDVLEQVDDGDLTFAEAATRYSVGPVPELGGDLGSIPANGMAEDWRAAVEAVEPGERTAVFDANGMATVLLVEGMGALKVDDVPGMRDKIFEKLRSEKMEVLFEEYMDRVRQMAVIEWK